MRRTATAYAAGLIFGAGLVVSTMIDPAKIVAFLDFGGAGGPWNPALLAVMGGAVLTHGLLLRGLAWRRGMPTSPRAFASTSGWAGVDRRVIVGSAIFGVGWGLTGYCPGPAIVALGFGAARTWAVVAAMVVGGLLAEALLQRRRETVAA